MTKKNLYTALTILIGLSNFKYAYSSSSEQLLQEIKNRGPVLHYESIENYFKERGDEKKKLVVGCGHNAFRYDSDTQKVKGCHSYDKDSKIQSFAHSDSFTITANDGMGEIFLRPDINGHFPDVLSSTTKFDEIFFEQVDGGTQKLYQGAYDHLTLRGILVDDRYGIDADDSASNKALTVYSLLKVGFTDIKFHDEAINPRNQRKSSLVIATTLPDLTNENDIFYTDCCVNEIKSLGNLDEYQYNFNLYDTIKGYYGNIPGLFKHLYTEYKKPLPLDYIHIYHSMKLGDVLTEEIVVSNPQDVALKKARMIDCLIKVGFTDIVFEDTIIETDKDPYSYYIISKKDFTETNQGPKNQYLVKAKKLHDVLLRRTDDNGNFISRIEELQNIKAFSLHNIKLNEYLRESFIDYPVTFRTLYKTLKKPVY